MKTYAERKAQVADKAKRWQLNFGNESHSYAELLVAQNEFARLAKRYGLVKEFRENGII